MWMRSTGTQRTFTYLLINNCPHSPVRFNNMLTTTGSNFTYIIDFSENSADDQHIISISISFQFAAAQRTLDLVSAYRDGVAEYRRKSRATRD